MGSMFPFLKTDGKSWRSKFSSFTFLSSVKGMWDTTEETDTGQNGKFKFRPAPKSAKKQNVSVGNYSESPRFIVLVCLSCTFKFSPMCMKLTVAPSVLPPEETEYSPVLQ